MESRTITAVGISGSPSQRSKSRSLLERALHALAGHGVSTRLIDLATLRADALLGRSPDDEVSAALEAVAGATIVVASTPVYRATYSGLLKVFFDLFSQRALEGKVGIVIATGGGPGHQLVLDHGLRPLCSSVGATVVPTGVYGTDAEFDNGAPRVQLIDRIERAATEAIVFARRTRHAPTPHPSTLAGS